MIAPGVRAQLEADFGRPFTDDECLPVGSLDALSFAHRQIARTLMGRSIISAALYVRTMCSDAVGLGAASRFLDTLASLPGGEPGTLYNPLLPPPAEREPKELTRLRRLPRAELVDEIVTGAANWFAEYDGSDEDAVRRALEERLRETAHEVRVDTHDPLYDPSYEAIGRIVKGIELVVSVDSGKYTFVTCEDGVIDVLRHGETWAGLRFAGNHALRSLMAELDAARVVLEAARQVVAQPELAAGTTLQRALDRHAALVDDRLAPSTWTK